jgi:hypothetical protein
MAQYSAQSKRNIKHIKHCPQTRALHHTSDVRISTILGLLKVVHQKADPIKDFNSTHHEEGDEAEHKKWDGTVLLNVK